MVIILEKASMPGIDVNFLQLIDPSCSLSSNDTHIMGAMSFSTCGTELEACIDKKQQFIPRPVLFLTVCLSCN